MKPVHRRNDDLLVLNASYYLLLKTVMERRFQHVLYVVLIDTYVLYIEQNCSSIVLQGNKSTTHLLVRQLEDLLACKEEVAGIVVEVEADNVAMKDAVEDFGPILECPVNI